MKFLVRISFGLLLCLISASTAWAQDPPATDVYLVGLADGVIVVPESGPVNLTNRDGYDNQPNFSPDNAYVYFTSFREGQTDIYRANVNNQSVEQVTDTPESEYSPTITPDGGISVIRVEADGTQRLWRFDMDGTSPSLLFTDIKPVGYHAWIDDDHIGMFILGNPPTLQIGSIESGKAERMADAIGRSLHRPPGMQTVSFVSKAQEDMWVIQTVDAAGETTEKITPTLEGSEDYAWTPQGTILMAQGGIFYEWTPGAEGWRVLYDFSEYGIAQITRIAVSPNGSRVAFVAGR